MLKPIYMYPKCVYSYTTVYKYECTILMILIVISTKHSI